ncbi:MAG: hypothetical protein IKC01_07675 [Clostridia bacterium]|nr:hypothetical protein [Clostridia bacterium]
MKLLLNICVPALGQNYDIFVPKTLRVKAVVSLVAETRENLFGHLYASSGEEWICSVDKNIVLKPMRLLKSTSYRKVII